MDIKREGVVKKKMIRRVIYLMIAAAVVALAGWRISQLKPAAPAVEMATIWSDTVKRGPMVRDVRGLGTLVPEDILWIQAAFDSQVSKIHTQSGDQVGPETVLLVLTNPQMEADAIDYEWQTKRAEANLADLKVRLQSQTFDLAVRRRHGAKRPETDGTHQGKRRAALPGPARAPDQRETRRRQVGASVQPVSDGEAEARHHEGFSRGADRVPKGADRKTPRHISAQKKAGRRADHPCGNTRPYAGDDAASRPARKARRRAGESGTAAQADGAFANRRDAGQGHPDRPACASRYAQRNRSRPRNQNRRLHRERNTHCRLQAGRAASGRSRARPKRRWDRRDRAAPQCPLRRAAGIRAAQQPCDAVQDR